MPISDTKCPDVRGEIPSPPPATKTRLRFVGKGLPKTSGEYYVTISKEMRLHPPYNCETDNASI